MYAGAVKALTSVFWVGMFRWSHRGADDGPQGILCGGRGQIGLIKKPINGFPNQSGHGFFLIPGKNLQPGMLGLCEIDLEPFCIHFTSETSSGESKNNVYIAMYT